MLQELGLYREPQPARLAGNIVVRRERATFPLDSPYGALPPSTVLGVGSIPSQVLTIENQTTFHVWARQHYNSDVLCIYTAGMPSLLGARCIFGCFLISPVQLQCCTGEISTKAGSGSLAS